MRIFRALLWGLPVGIFALIVIAMSGVSALADTGTYKIDDYIVILEPQDNGQVRITYEQTWEVLSGDIPWVTVGLPNSHFSMESKGGNAARVSAANSGGFSGVRVDLDRDYRPGEAFNIKFTVLQDNLLERLTSEKKWRIDYTPGWYDRAEIGRLEIKLISPVTYQTYSTISPNPDSTDGDVFTWERSNLAKGERFNIRVESVDGSFLTAATPAQSNSSFDPGILIFIVIFVALGGLIVWGIRRSIKARQATLNERLAEIEQKMEVDKETRQKIEKGFDEYVEKENLEPDEQGRYYDRSYGGYITPALWAAVIMNRTSRNQTTGNIHRPSCACACVSCACACACACAGGGAAGCSRKNLHECDACPPSNSLLSEKVKTRNC
jgi:hypothetical protein